MPTTLAPEDSPSEQCPMRAPSKSSSRLREVIHTRKTNILRSLLVMMGKEVHVSRSGSCTFEEGRGDFVLYVKKDNGSFSIQCRIYSNGNGKNWDRSVWFNKLQKHLSKQSIQADWADSSTLHLKQTFTSQVLVLRREQDFRDCFENFMNAAKVSESMCLHERPSQKYVLRKMKAALAA